MTATLKLGVQKCVYDLECQSLAYHALTEAYDIGIVVCACSLCGEAVGYACGADTLDLVGSNGDADEL